MYAGASGPKRGHIFYSTYIVDAGSWFGYKGFTTDNHSVIYLNPNGKQKIIPIRDSSQGQSSASNQTHSSAATVYSSPQQQPVASLLAPSKRLLPTSASSQRQYANSSPPLLMDPNFSVYHSNLQKFNNLNGYSVPTQVPANLAQSTRRSHTLQVVLRSSAPRCPSILGARCWRREARTS